MAVCECCVNVVLVWWYWCIQDGRTPLDCLLEQSDKDTLWNTHLVRGYGVLIAVIVAMVMLKCRLMPVL